MARVLFVDESQSLGSLVLKALLPYHRVRLAGNLLDAAGLLKNEVYDVTVLDLTPEASDGVEFLQRYKELHPQTPVIVTSEHGKADFIVRVIKAGAFDFIAKPYSEDEIKLAISRSLENRSLKNEIDYLRRQQDVIYDFDRIIAASTSMKKVIETIRKLSVTDSTVLMTGETGTGKSMLSGAIHFNSPRRNKPFVKINCANIPESLLESELFGHEKGAFTGANKVRAGRIEQANGGTVFLDEIGELSPSLQAKLLGVLEEKSFVRLGGNRTIHSDVRLIAATNRNLEELIRVGAFREDLYYRINVLRVHLPPLRERPECIEPLAYHLLEKACRSLKKAVRGFSPAVLELFKRYSWPGNIRELSNIIERAVLLEDGETIQRESVALSELPLLATMSDLPENEAGVVERNQAVQCIRDLVDQEKSLILEALENSLWIQKDAAAKLGIPPRVLHYKIKKHGITHPRWRKNK